MKKQKNNSKQRNEIFRKEVERRVDIANENMKLNVTEENRTAMIKYAAKFLRLFWMAEK